MKPTLVVLAAGMGSRYGGLKQVDPVGPNGEIVLDYSIYDAKRTGFGQVVFVIREDLEETFRERFEPARSSEIAFDYTFQKLDDIPRDVKSITKRRKPWGTGHAVLAARHCLDKPFAVINADDFYGAESYRIMAQFLARLSPGQQEVDQYALVGFKLRNTLSPNGKVARGICRVNRNGILQNVEEHTNLAVTPAGEIKGRNMQGQLRTLAGDTLVSMNMWGFTPSFLPQLEASFRQFLSAQRNQPNAEFYLPQAVDSLIKKDQCRVTVKPSSEKWFGVTYKEDRIAVSDCIKQRIIDGEYPANTLPGKWNC